MHGHADRAKLARRGVEMIDGGVRRRRDVVPRPLLCFFVQSHIEERISGGAVQRVDQALLREAPHVGLQEAPHSSGEANGAGLRGGVRQDEERQECCMSAPHFGGR